MTFEQWFKEVDQHVIAELGLGAEDLPDACHRDAYESGTTPKEWAEELIEGNLDDDFGM